MMTRIDLFMLKRVPDRALLLAVLVSLVASFVSLAWEAILLAMAMFIALFVFFVELVNRQSIREARDAVVAAFSNLDQVHGGKRWMGFESEIIRFREGDGFTWRLLCRTRRGLWFETIVYMSGGAHVERMEVQEISAHQAALALQDRAELYAKYFGQPTAA